MAESLRATSPGIRGLSAARRATTGLEIGGPSAIFARKGPLPLYPLFDRLDNCDFADATIWHGDAAEGTAFRYDDDRPPGRRYVRDGTSLDGIDDASYDVVLASHTLEHIANPLRALAEWKRVVGSQGHLILVVPHLENTFDHAAARDDARAHRGGLRALDRRGRHDARPGVHRAVRPVARARSPVPPGLRAADPRAGGESHRPSPRLRHGAGRAAARPRRLRARLDRDRSPLPHRRRCSSERARARQPPLPLEHGRLEIQERLSDATV